MTNEELIDILTRIMRCGYVVFNERDWDGEAGVYLDPPQPELTIDGTLDISEKERMFLMGLRGSEPLRYPEPVDPLKPYTGYSVGIKRDDR